MDESSDTEYNRAGDSDEEEEEEDAASVVEEASEVNEFDPMPALITHDNNVYIVPEEKRITRDIITPFEMSHLIQQLVVLIEKGHLVPDFPIVKNNVYYIAHEFVKRRKCPLKITRKYEYRNKIFMEIMDPNNMIIQDDWNPN